MKNEIEQGQHPKCTRANQNPLTEAQKDRIVEMYPNHQLKQIHAEIGCSFDTIRRILIERGIKTKRQANAVVTENIINLIAGGMAPIDVMIMLEVSEDRVKNVLTNHKSRILMEKKCKEIEERERYIDSLRVRERAQVRNYFQNGKRYQDLTEVIGGC